MPRIEEAKTKAYKESERLSDYSTISGTYLPRYRFGDVSDSASASALTPRASLETFIVALPVLADGISSFDRFLGLTVSITVGMIARHPTDADTFAGPRKHGKSSTCQRGIEPGELHELALPKRER